MSERPDLDAIEERLKTLDPGGWRPTASKLLAYARQFERLTIEMDEKVRRLEAQHAHALKALGLEETLRADAEAKIRRLEAELAARDPLAMSQRIAELLEERRRLEAERDELFTKARILIAEKASWNIDSKLIEDRLRARAEAAERERDRLKAELEESLTELVEAERERDEARAKVDRLQGLLDHLGRDALRTSYWNELRRRLLRRMRKAHHKRGEGEEASTTNVVEPLSAGIVGNPAVPPDEELRLGPDVDREALEKAPNVIPEGYFEKHPLKELRDGKWVEVKKDEGEGGGG